MHINTYYLGGMGRRGGGLTELGFGEHGVDLEALCVCQFLQMELVSLGHVLQVLPVGLFVLLHLLPWNHHTQCGPCLRDNLGHLQGKLSIQCPVDLGKDYKVRMWFI